MFKKIIGISLALLMIMTCAMPFVSAAPEISLINNVEPNATGAATTMMVKNDKYIFTIADKNVEIYSYNKADASVAPTFLTSFSYTSHRDFGGGTIATMLLKPTNLELYTYEGKDYLLVPFCKPTYGDVSKTGYPRIAIVDVTTVTEGVQPTCKGLVKLEDNAAYAYTKVNSIGRVHILYSMWNETRVRYSLLGFKLAMDKVGENVYNWEVDSTKQSPMVLSGNTVFYKENAALDTTMSLNAAYIDGNYAYATSSNKFAVYNIADYGALAKLGEYDMINTLADKYHQNSVWNSITASGDYVFVGMAQNAQSHGGLNVYDVSLTKTTGTKDANVAPTRMGSIRPSAGGDRALCNGATINGDYLYVSFGIADELAVYNISDLANFDFSTRAKRLTSLNLVSILPDAHEKVTTYEENGWESETWHQNGFHSMIIDGSTLYFTDTYYGIRTADISSLVEMGTPEVYNGDDKLEALADGSLKAKVTVSNATGSEMEVGTLILAYYKNGKLDLVKTSEISVPAGKAGHVAATAEALSVSGAATGDYVTAMFWSDIDDKLIPLTGSTTVAK